MPVSLALILTAGVMIACGIYLMLERTLTRIIIGFVLLGNGVNLLYIIAAGPRGLPPFEGTGDPSEMSDPLPFAMVLTAIVITLGVTALVMALAYRAWQLFGHDEVPDDVEDRRVLRRSRRRNGGRGQSVGWADALDEDARRGALAVSQGLGRPTGGDGDDDDPLSSDLSSPEDAPQDATEADEWEDDGPDDPADGFEEPSAQWHGSGPAAAETQQGILPGTGPATDAGDHEEEIDEIETLDEHPATADPAIAAQKEEERP